MSRRSGSRIDIERMGLDDQNKGTSHLHPAQSHVAAALPSNRRRRLSVRRLVLPLAVVALLTTVISGCSADQIVLGQNRAVVDPHGATRRVVRADGKAVECWVARSPALGKVGTGNGDGGNGHAGNGDAANGRAGPATKPAAEPEAVVLFFVGKHARADQWTTAVAGAWGDLPVEVWGVNYPGSGGSDGPVSLARVGPNAVAAFDAAKTAHGDKPVFIHAASFGTTAALHVAARRPVAGMILQNPPPLWQLLMGRYGWWNLWLIALPVSAQVPPNLDSIANAGKCSTPTVFISSQNDDVVPPAYQKKVIDAYAGPKRVVPVKGAAHASPLTKEASAQVAAGRAWLWEQATSGGAK